MYEFTQFMYVMNAELCQVGTDLCTKPTDLSHNPRLYIGSYLTMRYIHRRLQAHNCIL